MIPGVSKRKSYAYFDRRYILTLIDIKAVCTKESARFDKKAGELCNIFPELGLVQLALTRVSKYREYSSSDTVRPQNSPTGQEVHL